MTVVLNEVDWFAPPDPAVPGNVPHYRGCSICGESASRDFMDGRDPRRFWQELEDGRAVLDVCEGCIDAYLSEGVWA
jgi:hypothetical protein